MRRYLWQEREAAAKQQEMEAARREATEKAKEYEGVRSEVRSHTQYLYLSHLTTFACPGVCHMPTFWALATDWDNLRSAASILVIMQKLQFPRGRAQVIILWGSAAFAWHLAKQPSKGLESIRGNA